MPESISYRHDWIKYEAIKTSIQDLITITGKTATPMLQMASQRKINNMIFLLF